MIKTYRKTAIIQAQQFNGSDEMIDSYQIRVSHGDHIGNKPSYLLHTLKGNMSLKVGDWITNSFQWGRWVVPDNVFKSSYTKVRGYTFKKMSLDEAYKQIKYRIGEKAE